jgi:hypothetical protein
MNSQPNPEAKSRRSRFEDGAIDATIPLRNRGDTFSWVSKAERNYSATEKEALALVWATDHFHPYLYRRKFTLITDHCPLTWLKSIKEPKGRLARWLLTISEYDWQIRHKAGKHHRNADGLSRAPLPSKCHLQMENDRPLNICLLVVADYYTK